MTVEQLIKELQELPPHLLVVLAADSEGNSYSPASGFGDIMWYYPDNSWSGEMHEEAPEEGRDTGAVPAVTLFPIN